MDTYKAKEYSRNKIGILTVHRAHNYGSVLQCYALQSYLQNLGLQVKIIDYRQKWTESVYEGFSIYYIWKCILRQDIHSIIRYWRERDKRKPRTLISKSVFNQFQKRFNLTKKCTAKLPEEFDAIIIGSDQLWSHQCIGGYDRFYLGNFRHSKKSKLIGYAISAGEDSIYHLYKHGLKKIISRFNVLSMREDYIADYIYDLISVKLPTVCDPVILADESVWNSLIDKNWSKRNKYIVTYCAREVPYQPTFLQDKAGELAAKLNYEIIDLSDMNHTVEDFISAIKYAEYIFTSSFHAVVFSVLLETRCFAIKLGDTLDIRYVNFLTSIGLQEELFPMNFEPYEFNINFKQAKRILETKRKSSEVFLQKALTDLIN